VPEPSISAVVSIGGGGRGFVVGARGKRYVVTARHCLRKMPRSNFIGAFVGNLVRTDHESLWMPDRDPVYFVSPTWTKPITRQQEAEFRRGAIALQPVLIHSGQDIAVLGDPSDGSEAYDAFVGSREALGLAPPPSTELFSARLLSLDGAWFGCQVQWHCDDYPIVYIKEFDKPLLSGMSGSPVIDDSGRAFGIVSEVGYIEGKAVCLVRCLPDWLWP
jgi:hypothetical protein